MMNRLSLEEYGCALSLIGKARSEDFFTRCSAVGFDRKKRILGISYNGLCSGFIPEEWMKRDANRERKNDYYLHAESNLFSMISGDECELLCLNISPCINCAKIIAGHNVKRVVFLKEYHRCSKFKDFFDFYQISYSELPRHSKLNILNYIKNLKNFEEIL